MLEVAGTVCLRLSEGLTRWQPSLLIVVFYVLSSGINSFVVCMLGLGSLYAVWSGAETVATAAIGFWWFKEPVTALKLGSIGLIVVGSLGRMPGSPFKWIKSTENGHLYPSANNRTIMAIPDCQTLMLPLLRLAGDNQEHRFRDAVEQLARQFSISDQERNTLLPSGTAPVFDNRVGWARTYLKQATLIESRKRGVFNITARGKALLATTPNRVDNSTLEQYSEFLDFKLRRGEDKPSINPPQKITPQPQPQITSESQSDSTPEEIFSQAYQILRSSLKAELLEQIKASSPAFFERLIIDLLVGMGYGGSRQDAGKAIGKSGDGGIDGIIKEDKLGLDVIYIQAKRWEGTVGRPEIQKFAGALQGQRANKGVFITTSSFSRDAEEYANIISSKIILIPGEQLASLMVGHNIGVSPVSRYELKRIDSDYFDGENL